MNNESTETRESIIENNETKIGVCQRTLHHQDTLNTIQSRVIVIHNDQGTIIVICGGSVHKDTLCRIGGSGTS
jgi:methylmalonyl-CoA mutase cobalamin-binding subunit